MNLPGWEVRRPMIVVVDLEDVEGIDVVVMKGWKRRYVYMAVIWLAELPSRSRGSEMCSAMR
jgi:hypothetical protein